VNGGVGQLFNGGVIPHLSSLDKAAAIYRLALACMQR